MARLSQLAVTRAKLPLVKLLSYQAAIEIIDKATTPTETIEIHLEETLGLFLASPLIAKLDSPRFDNSAVDGYALPRKAQKGDKFAVIGEARAGEPSHPQLEAAQALRVFTGAPVPKSVQAIAMQEDVRRDGSSMTLEATIGLGQGIRRAGEDFHAGQTLAATGAQVTPPLIGLAAASGNSTIAVHRKPKVAIITCGNELRPISENLQPGQIPNSNQPALSAALRSIGLDTTFYHVADDQAQTDREVVEALRSHDVLITTGGVSVGDYDLLKASFAKACVEEKFWRLAIKPGMPTYFGTSGEKLIFGLPGNPVAALVTYFLFARPALLKQLGAPTPWPKAKAAKFNGQAEKKEGRLEFMRGCLEDDGSVTASTGRGSHISSSLVGANCLILFPIDKIELHEGEAVEVIPLDWSI